MGEIFDSVSSCGQDKARGAPKNLLAIYVTRFFWGLSSFGGHSRGHISSLHQFRQCDWAASLTSHTTSLSALTVLVASCICDLTLPPLAASTANRSLEC